MDLSPLASHFTPHTCTRQRWWLRSVPVVIRSVMRVESLCGARRGQFSSDNIYPTEARRESCERFHLDQMAQATVYPPSLMPSYPLHIHSIQAHARAYLPTLKMFTHGPVRRRARIDSTDFYICHLSTRRTSRSRKRALNASDSSAVPHRSYWHEKCPEVRKTLEETKKN